MRTLFAPKKHHASSTILPKWVIKLIGIFQSKDTQLIAFFCFLFLILVIKLFYIQIIKHNHYDIQLSKQYYKESFFLPERGNIFALDKGGHTVQLTQNITFYDLALDPKDLTEFPPKTEGGTPIPMKPRFIELIAPIIYQHLCELNGMHVPTKTECVKNVELFAGVDLLPQQPELFYYGSGELSPAYESFDFTGYQEHFDKVVQQFTQEQAMQLIMKRLDEKIKIGTKQGNYLGYFTEPKFLEEVKQLNFPFLSIQNEHYLYIIPSAINSRSSAITQVKNLLQKWKYPISTHFERLFELQEWRYIKLISGLNPKLAEEVRTLKLEHQHEKSQKNKEKKIYTEIPVLYGLILEPYTTRYYPYGDFMSNIIGYVNKAGVAYYGIEQYFDDILKGKKGEIRGRSSGLAGNIGTHDFEITHPTDGSDIYLTIDVGLQREAERIAKQELETTRADAINILVLDIEKGEVKAGVNAPSFDPNNYNDAYTLMPLGKEYAHIVDDLTYVDIPVYIFTGNDYKLASLEERTTTGLKKYLNTNVYGPSVFVDKNISVPFEPGSIFKAFTVAIGLDTDELSLKDEYLDEGFVKIGEQIIKNASKICEGQHSFLHALTFSCNIGMIRIVQKIQKYIFYNYLTKLGFGELTKIELAGEKEGFLDNVNIVSIARILNNSFGQGLTTTQIQLAAAYAALVNGGTYIRPTIISSIRQKEESSASIHSSSDSLFEYARNEERKQIFKPGTSESLKEGLWEVLNHNPEVSHTANISGVKLGAKSGTAQISFRGRYQRGEGRTNGTFAGFISMDNPKYVILIWVRRPRRSQWGGVTAGPIFKQLASYILTYDL